MTVTAHPVAVGTLSSADLAQASGLRQDLVERFVPGTDTPSGRVYPADRIAVAVMVKELTDASAPAQLIDTRVREFFTHTPPPVRRTGSATPGVTRRALWMAVGATAAASMIVGGLAGGLLRSQDNSGAASTMTTVTAAAPAPELNPTVPAAPDPVCAEWAPIADAVHASTTEWGSKGGDPALPASSWTPEQRALNADTLPILQRYTADLRRLADKASDPFLVALLRAQANYQQKFTERLMDYNPSDLALWRSALDYSAAVRSTCKTIAPR